MRIAHTLPSQLESLNARTQLAFTPLPLGGATLTLRYIKQPLGFQIDPYSVKKELRTSRRNFLEANSMAEKKVSIELASP